MTGIFKSNFTLKFKNNQIEKQYQVSRQKGFKKSLIIKCLILICISITNDLLFWLTKPTRLEENIWGYLSISSTILSGIHLLMLVMSIFVENHVILRYVSYINFVILSLTSINLRAYLSIIINLDYSIYSLVFALEDLFRLTCFFTNLLDFIEGFYLFIFLSLLNYLVNGPFFPFNLHIRFAIIAIMNAIVCLMSYFYVREKRRTFYFDYNNEKSLKWYRSVVENISSGFISIVNSKLNYINKALITTLMKQKTREIIISDLSLNADDDRNITNETALLNSLSNSKLNLIMQELFDKIIFKENEMKYENKNNYDSASNYLLENNEENFILLGSSSMTTARNNTIEYFEIFGRSYNDGQEDRFEFLFNDVTKVKLEEEINADCKYKKIFLAKIAHEFKNPILCISELIDQISDKIASDNGTTNLENDDSICFKNNSLIQIKGHLKQVKHMSNYLLILVKDMDFFSLTLFGSSTKLKLEKEIVKFKDFLLFCKNVTKTLIKKYLKEQSINFNLEYSNLPTEIYTDDVRLKQVLINLLSNSVKYTNNGYITLKVVGNDDILRFEVKDTGKGLSEEQQMYLKSNGEGLREISKLGSGLGLSIVKDILALFGSTLEYETKENEESTFAFNITTLRHSDKNKISKDLVVLNNQMIVENNSNSSKYSEFSRSTIKREFIPYNINDFTPKNEDSDNRLSSILMDSENSKINIKQNSKYIMVVDDETTTRKSTIRLLNNYLDSINENNFVIVEAEDGIECLYLYYQHKKEGLNISCIISDETMNYINGSACAKILYDMSLKG